jgi:RecG-like helicase
MAFMHALLQEHSRGQDVACHDLKLRGAGQLFGQRQSGPADMGLGALLSATDLAMDDDTVAAARAAAAALAKRHGLDGLPEPLLAALAGYRMTSLLALRMQDIDMHM